MYLPISNIYLRPSIAEGGAAPAGQARVPPAAPRPCPWPRPPSAGTSPSPGTAPSPATSSRTNHSATCSTRVWSRCVPTYLHIYIYLHIWSAGPAGEEQELPVPQQGGEPGWLPGRLRRAGRGRGRAPGQHEVAGALPARARQPAGTRWGP